MSATGWTDDRLMQAYDLIEAVFIDAQRHERGTDALNALCKVRSQIVLADEIIKEDAA